MRFTSFVFIFMLTGCASVQAPGYISRADHPYNRKYYASFEKVTSAFVFILKHKGWTIISEADPSVYERDDRYDNNEYRNLLLVTETKKNFRVIYSTFTRLNIFIHSLDNTCDVEVRYEAQTSVVKQFISTRNDGLVQGILDAVQQEVDR